ncbi:MULTISPECIES: transposase [Cyanophyceae]|uniref:IS701 family transposase n=1 Tax=Cyanophyceae TaxID=3028117 RepID=UPI0018F00F36|nr:MULTISPECIES: transposase [Cyanophyceae]
MEFMSMMIAFAPLFSQRVWPQALTLVMGALLAPGKRTVSQLLRVMGLADEPQFQRYHRVLNRAVWSSRQASRILLTILVTTFAADGVMVMGLDDTIERRWGKRIAARGIYRDPVRSSQEHFVKTSGLRWLSLMLLVPIPWAQRVWALPFLTVLAPSERYNQTQGRRHKALTDWARQMLIQVRRWLGHRPIVVVADSSFAALDFLASVSHLPNPVHVVTRLRLDAALYKPAPPRDATPSDVLAKSGNAWPP